MRPERAVAASMSCPSPDPSLPWVQADFLMNSLPLCAVYSLMEWGSRPRRLDAFSPMVGGLPVKQQVFTRLSHEIHKTRTFGPEIAASKKKSRQRPATSCPPCPTWSSPRALPRKSKSSSEKPPPFLLIFLLPPRSARQVQLRRTSREDAAESVNVTTLGRCTRSSSSTAFRVDLGFARARRSASSTRISTCWPARRGGNMFFNERAAVVQRARSQPKGGRGCSLHGMKELLARLYPDLFSTPAELEMWGLVRVLICRVVMSAC